MIHMFYLSDGLIWETYFETVEEFENCFKLGMYIDVVVLEVVYQKG